MGAISILRPLLRDAARMDRSQILFVTALRNAAGVAAPLAVGAATGQLLTGLSVSIGALQVAFADRPGPYRLRAGRMLLVGLCAALSVFAGATTGSIGPLATALAAIWGFGGGLLVALGQTATQVGLTSMILLVVFGARPASPHQAGAEAGLIMIGGILQTLLSIAAWPVRRFSPQRDALATVFRELAAYTRAPSAPDSAPLATGAITGASTTLAAAGRDHSAAGEALRALLDEAERIRLELLALDDARRWLRGEGSDEATSSQIDETLAAAGATLDALADGLATGRRPVNADAPLGRIEAASHALRPLSKEGTGGPYHVRVAATRARIDALGGQLRAAVRIATEGGVSDEEATKVEGRRPPALRLREPAAILRANLTLRSAACRHAVRLAFCLAAANAFAHGSNLPRAYWVPLTVAIVLKPDFAATFTRGFGRVAGTILGLALATILVYTLFGDFAARIALIGALMFAIRSLGPANYGLLVVGVTALVVVLTSFAGAPPEATIVERGIYTLTGGAFALIVYAAWPTWERTQTPALLADLLDAYRRYFAAVMTGYLDPRRYEPGATEVTRLAARLARSNAEASIDRLHGEPARSTEDRDRADGLLANSHRFVHSVMALEADLYHASEAPAPPELRTFVDDVDATLQALGHTLRDPPYRLDPDSLPSLRADQRALAGLNGAEQNGDDATGHAGYHLAVIASETDRIADSVNTMAELLRRSGA